MLVASAPFGASGEHGRPLGDLHAKGTVDILLGSRSIAISESSYAYFPGEAIATRSNSAATLTLWDGAVIFAPDSAARVNGERGRYRIDLDRGALRVRFGPSSSFEIRVGDRRIRPTAIQPVTAGPQAQLDALVAVEGDGGLKVHSYGGRFEVDVAPGRSEVVALGQQKTFSREGLLVAVRSAGSATRPVGAAKRGSSNWLARAVGLTVLAVEVALIILLTNDGSSGGGAGSPS
jgi:ferric-dicitrate binding protein FerR (iron transport regulator)